MNMSWSLNVVVLTHGRAAMSCALLRQLAQQDYMGQFAVTVVDDSHRLEADVIRAACECHGFDYMTRAGSISDKRNAGWGARTSDITVYVDSDCVVQKGFLSAHARAYASPTVGAAAGPTRFEGGTSVIWRTIKSSQFLVGFELPARVDSLAWAPTANLSVRTDVLRQLGGFTDIPGLGYAGEDVDLGLRIADAGYVIVAVPEAQAAHRAEPWQGWLLFARKVWRWGLAEWHLLSLHVGWRRPEFPPPLANMVFVPLAVALLFVRSQQAAVCAAIPAVTLIANAGLQSASSDRSPYSALATIYADCFRAALIWQSLRRLSALGLQFKLVFADGHLEAEWKSRVIWTWALTAPLLIATLAFP